MLDFNLLEGIEGKIIYVDVDQTLCISKHKNADGEFDYNYSTPIQENIDIVNKLYEKNTIVLFTARGKRTGKIDWTGFTIAQVNKWGIKHHEISFNKPHYDLMICDKCINNFGQLAEYNF